tara:strand:+ start:177 stop:395 length:219 start_codon:yes stop_codon:yes gene_type:complete
MKIIGLILIAFGLTDVICSWIGIDVWGEWIGVELPYAIWYVSGYAETGIGYLLLNKAGSNNEIETDEIETDE